MNLSSKYLKAWLTFNTSPTDDAKGNNWTTYGNPTIGTANAFNGKALQLDGQSYIKLSDVELGGQNFYIDGWVYVDSSSPNYARVLHIVGQSGFALVSVRKSATNSTRLDFWVNSTADVSKDNGYTVTSTATSIGKRVHFKLLYRYDDRYMRLYINDGDGVYRASVPQFNRQKFTIYIGAKADGSQGVIGSVDEVRIYDGTYLSSGNNSPPTLADYQNITFSVDTVRNVANPALNWRYENYGTADLLAVSGTTLTDLPITQSATGSAFYQTTRTKCFDIPATPEIWVKFDVFFDGTNRWRAYNGGSNGFSGICSYSNNSGGNFGIWQNSNKIQDFQNVCKTNQLQTVLLHMITGSSGGIVEAWLDGVKIYTYTGNVNNGEDFADIYLQSDGAGTFFSNVIISNIEIQLFEGWHGVSVDVQRDTSLAVQVSVDVVRTLKEPRTIVQISTVRSVFVPFVVQSAGEDFFQCFFSDHDEGSNIFEQYNWSGVSPLAVLPFSEQQFQFPDTDEVWFRCFAYSNGNYLLKIFVGEDGKESGVAMDRYTTETSVVLTGQAENINMYEFDGLIFGDEDDYHGHYLIHWKSGLRDGVVEIWYADQFFATNPEVHKLVKIASKTGNVNNGQPLNKIRITLTKSPNTPEQWLPTEYREDYAWELRYIVLSNSEIDVRGNRPTLVFPDVQRDVFRSAIFTADVIRRIPHRVFIAPQDPLINETTGVQSFQIELAAQQLTDRVTYTSVNPADIMEQVRGSYLDYVFDMRVEEITQRGALYTCQLCSDVDAILYTQHSYSLDNDFEVYELDRVKKKINRRSTSGTINVDSDAVIQKSFVSSHLWAISRAMGKQLVAYTKEQGVLFEPSQDINFKDYREYLNFQFDDFVTTLDIEQERTTFADLLRELFGWSSRIPHLLVNCWLRGNKLFAVQRGHEKNLVDITNLKCSIPLFRKSLMRTAWGASPEETYTVTRHFNGLWFSFSPNDSSSDGDTQYSYNEVSKGKYLLKETTTRNKDGSYVVTTYKYDANDQLVRETRTEYDAGGTVVDETEIYHNYLTPSQRHTKKVSDGTEESSVIGSHVSGLYSPTNMIIENVIAPHDESFNVTVEGNPLIDPAFPAVDEEKLAELTYAIIWLNRKTQESVLIDIYDYPHVIDFDDRIIFNGATYFLESNSVTKTPRIVNKQTLQLVRWY